MKKLFAILLVVAMCAAMCACDGGENPTQTTTDPQSNPSESTTPGTTVPETTDPIVNNETKVITVSDYLADESKWEDDGGYYDMDSEKIFFDNFAAGDYCAVRLSEEAQNVTYKFNVTIHKLAPVSMDDWTWWDSELLVIARSAIAGNSWQDDGSQTGYTLTSWGDMSTVFIGRCGKDDAFGEYAWNINDGQPHEIELSVVNNEDNTAVTITVKVDGAEIASVVDDGTVVKEGRPNLYPNAGGLTIRCKWLEVTVE